MSRNTIIVSYDALSWMSVAVLGGTTQRLTIRRPSLDIYSTTVHSTSQLQWKWWNCFSNWVHCYKIERQQRQLLRMSAYTLKINSWTSVAVLFMTSWWIAEWSWYCGFGQPFFCANSSSTCTNHDQVHLHRWTIDVHVYTMMNKLSGITSLFILIFHFHFLFIFHFA